MRDSFRMLERFGASPAIISSDGVEISYEDLAGMADRFATALPSSKCLVVIEVANEIEALVAYVATIRSGHTALLLAPGAIAKFPTILSTYDPHVVYRKIDDVWSMSVSSESPSLEAPDDLAVLLSTSGTTGDHKMVMLSYSNLQANARSIAEYLSITPDQRAITTLEFSYSYGLSVVNSHLLTGATLLLTRQSVIEPGFWDFFREQDATSFALVPYSFELLERIGFDSYSLPTLKYITQAGGRLSAKLVTKYGQLGRDRGWKLFVMYGQTEATARMAYLPPEHLSRFPDCIGQAIPEGRLSLVDESGIEITTPDVPGELVYRGPNVMLGYARTATDLANPSRPSELRTGDLALVNKSGFFRIVGRSTRFAKIFGLRINFDVVEESLAAQGVRAACCGDDELLVIATLDDSAADAALSLVDEKYGLGRSVVVLLTLGDFPLLANGKTDYRELLRLGKANKAQQVVEAVQANTNTQHMLLEAFGRAVNSTAIQPTDSFLSLGGDSLNYVGLSIELDRILGCLPQGWERKSISDLAKYRNESVSALAPSASLGMDMLLRALAIVAVVTQHAGFRTFGGAAFLMFLSGWNLARFHHEHLRQNPIRRVLAPFFLRIILPFYAFVMAYGLYRQKLFLPELLLVGNYFDRAHSFLTPLWFLQALFQCLLLMSVLVPLLGRVGVWHDLRFAKVSAVIVATLAVQHLCVAAWPSYNWTYSLAAVLPVFLIGWFTAFAKRPRERWLCSLAIVGTPWLLANETVFSGIQSTIVLCASGLLMVWVPRIWATQWVARVVSAVASSSLHIYLWHVFPLWVLLTLSRPSYPLLAVVIAIVGGVILHRVAAVLERTARAFVGSIRKMRVPPSDVVLCDG